MQRFEAYPSRAKLIGLFLLTIAMVAMAAFCTTLPGIVAKIAGWAGGLFFGLGFILVPRAWFRASKPRIVMDDFGIHTGSSMGVVDWNDIVGFRIDSMHGTHFLSVFVHDVTKYLDRLAPLAQQSAKTHPYMGLSEIALCFVGLSPGIAEACYYLSERGYIIENR